jgi:MYXO-CTERM domain-containing protein
VEPWGRPVVEPGASRCTVVVHAEALRGPVVCQAGSTTTGSMTTARAWHTLVGLQTGRVLAASGQTLPSCPTCSPQPTKTAELYDPGSGTWAATGSLQRARRFHTTAVLSSGKALAVGGESDTSGLSGSTAELYDPAAGTWSGGGSLISFHFHHTETVLSSGNVLVAGGTNDANTPVKSTDLYNPGTNSWSSVGSLGTARQLHTATLLQTGQVLAVGGLNASGNALKSVELFFEGSGWTAVAPLTSARAGHAAGLGPDGRVVVGGGGDNGSPIGSTEIFDPSTSQWSGAGLLAPPFSSAASTSLANGCLMVTGDNSTGASHVHAFDFRALAWDDLGDLNVARQDHAAASVAGTLVVVSGGFPFGSGVAITSAETFSLTATGQTCTQPCECVSGQCVNGVCCAGVRPNGAACDNTCQCQSGFCVDGFCCDKGCDGLCEACSASMKGSGHDGACGPVAAGTDPTNDCKDDGAASCGQDGLCDGHGKCARYPNGAICDPLSCDPKTGKVTQGDCNGVGQCIEKEHDCAPYVCTSNGECKTKCSSIDDCTEGNVCNDAGTCIPATQNPPETFGGCCSVAGQAPSRPWDWALLPAAAALALLRRRGRR